METAASPIETRPAGLVRRVLAMIYDGLLLAGLWMITTALWLPASDGRAVAPGTPFYPLYQTSLLLVSFAFFAWFWTHGGQTLGMRAWRLRLVTNNGESIGLRRAALRFVIAIVSWLPLGLGFLWALFDKRHRTWYDLFSETEMRVEPKS